MAKTKLVELEADAIERWELTQICIVHRVGQVALSEASVAIAVSAPHREAAFEAGKWLIDTLKTVVPIWKQEHWSDGTSQWVHPGLDAAPHQSGRTAELGKHELGDSGSARDN
jgi:molybdopterin synthase catalytic subunit